MASGVLMLVEELERRDEAAAAALARVEALQADVDRIRARAAAVIAFLAGLPGERGRRAEAVRAAEEHVGAAEAALAAAERVLERADGRGKEQERAVAGRAAAGAREDVRVAAGELARARDRVAALEAEADQALAEAEALEGEAAEVAAHLAALPRLAPGARPVPAHGLDAVEAWAARARAALLVVHGALLTERDAIVREANELGSSVLGEALGPTSVAGVRARVARALETRSP